MSTIESYSSRGYSLTRAGLNAQEKIAESDYRWARAQSNLCANSTVQTTNDARGLDVRVDRGIAR